jgi:hypothetical protein
MVLYMLGILESDEGNLGRARALIDEAIAMNAKTGLQNVLTDTLAVSAHLSLLEGDLSTARSLIRQVLRVARDDGERDTMVEVLPAFAVLRATEGDAVTAARIVGALDAAPLEAWAWTAYYRLVRGRYEQALVAARAALSSEAFAIARAEGQAMTLEQAVAYALADGRPETKDA